MRQEIQSAVAAVVKDLFDIGVETELTRPDEQFGDYAVNTALQLARKLNKTPRAIAEAIKQNLNHEYIENVEIASPGFLNIRLTDAALFKQIEQQPHQRYKEQEILVEFGDPNPFKEMHLGHLYTAIVGDAIAHLLEAAGATVRRLSYHGDVGLHVAKAIWAMLQDETIQNILKHTNDEILSVANNPADELFHNQVITHLAGSLGLFYKTGAEAYENDEKARNDIREINEHIYKRDDETINRLHELGTKFSFADFDDSFKELEINYHPDGRYLESQTEKIGADYVRKNTGKVFEKSDGAIVYRGEKVGLHTRVFINSRGLPTYEAKDLGLAELKKRDFPNASRSIVITAHEQSEYFKVMLAALKEIDSQLADMTTHLAHGFLSLTTGKMSSRLGNVYSAKSLVWNVEEEIKRQYPETKKENKTYLAAVKYTFLKHRIGSDIVFDLQESVSLEGNSGPYLQYAHARARSILEKAGENGLEGQEGLEPDERSLLRKIGEFSEVVDGAVTELLPSHITTYLYELAQVFNRFYEHNRVLDDPRQNMRLQLIKAYANTLKKGLELLNISAPNRM